MNRRKFLLAAVTSFAGFALAPLTEVTAAPARKALPRLKVEQLGSGDVSFGYHAAGPEEGRPVLLLHDFGYDIHSFVDVIPLLTAQGFRVLVPYMRGHGATRFKDKTTPRTATPEELGMDALTVIDSLHHPEAVVAGIGQGAVAARAFARLKPTRCKGIVAVDGIATAPERAALQKDRRGYARKLWSANSPDWRFDEAVFARAAKSFDNPDFVQILSSVTDVALPDISAPVLALHGNASGVPATDPAARIIEGAGHNLALAAPQAFADAVAEMVRSAKWRT
jgi:pimeloyl-ACP methyl ester carboxylesterase